MHVTGIDLSTFAVDLVTVPLDGNGPPVWHRFPLTGQDAFDRARSVAQAMPGPASVLWDDVIAVGIEHPAGHHGAGPLLRIQGSILAQIPARMLVEPFPPAKWRKAVGLPGNASKDDITISSTLLRTSTLVLEARVHAYVEDWPQDAHDAHLIALATRQAISTEEAA